MPKQKVNLNLLNVTDLVTMRDEIDRVLGTKIDAERQKLQARLTALQAFALGGQRTAVTPALGPISGRVRMSRKVHALKGRKVAAKYRGPKGETWTGRGLAPRWLADLEANGKKRERFLI